MRHNPIRLVLSMDNSCICHVKCPPNVAPSYIHTGLGDTAPPSGGRDSEVRGGVHCQTLVRTCCSDTEWLRYLKFLYMKSSELLNDVTVDV